MTEKGKIQRVIMLSKVARLASLKLCDLGILTKKETLTIVNIFVDALTRAKNKKE